MTQALRALSNRNEIIRLEIVAASPVLKTCHEKLERLRIFEELTWCDALQDAMAEGRVKMRVPGVLRQQEAEHVTAAMAKLLKPGVGLQKTMVQYQRLTVSRLCHSTCGRKVGWQRSS